MLYVWDRYRELGADLHLVPSDDGMTIPLERMLAAIDERTAIVPISHGIYVSGALQDVKAICARAHEVGALVMVESYQTVGAMPIDVHEWDADIVVGGSHKWLCAGPGTAFLWMKPALRERLRPRLTGWMGHADPFSFEPRRSLRQRPPPLPRRHALDARLLRRPRRLREPPRDRPRPHPGPQLALAHIIIERAQATGLTVHSPLADEQRTGFVAVDFPTSEAASKQLIAERFKLDWRPNCGLPPRAALYNTEAEVHRLMDRVVALAGRA